MDCNALLAPAIGYARRGWSILPIRQGMKRPAVRSWERLQTERATESTLRLWFTRPNVGGVAVVLGDVSGGLVCRDFDTMTGYAKWAADHPDLARTLPTVATARGRHVYFRADYRGIRKLSDGELRGGGYCLLPPSTHPTGSRYEWAVPLPDGPLPRLDPFACGLGADATERRRDREAQIQRNRETEAIKGRGAALDDVIQLTLPLAEKQRNRQLFELARGLRSLPQYAEADLAALQPVVRRWHALALPAIATKDFEVTWLDFRYAWKRVRCPWGQGVVETAFSEAMNNPAPPAALRYGSELVRLLVGLCAAMQRACRSDPFYLSCRTVGRLLGIDHATAARWLEALVDDGVLTVVARGGTVGAPRSATRYRFVGDGKSLGEGA